MIVVSLPDGGQSVSLRHGELPLVSEDLIDERSVPRGSEE
jgi:hypothetical protein